MGAVQLEAGEDRKGFCSPASPLAPPAPTAPQHAFQLPAAPPELFTQGNSCDKGTKIAQNDGKHFVDSQAEKRGNEAVRRTECGAGSAAASRATATPLAGPAPSLESCLPHQGCCQDIASHSSPIPSAPRTWRSKPAAPTGMQGKAPVHAPGSRAAREVH